MRRLLHIAFALLIVSVGIAGCKDDSTSVVSHATDPEKVPTMTTSDVQTVISDSGHTRYRIAAPLWNMFEEAKEPHWTFPEGVTCEELDNNYNTVSTIKCDSAYFDKNKSLWKLVGNVHITNVTGDIGTNMRTGSTATRSFTSRNRAASSRDMDMSPTSGSPPTS